MYALGFCPQQIIPDLSSWRDSAQEAEVTDIGRFQALISRNGAMSDEVLKAYVLCTFVVMCGDLREYREIGSGNELAILDRILTNTKVVSGDAADSTLEFGRDFILSCSDIRSLTRVIAHELGHLFFDALYGSGGLTSIPAISELVRALGDALPGMIDTASAAVGQPPRTGDLRMRFLPGALCVLCTCEDLPRGSYTHFSFSNGGGPIDLSTALILAYCVTASLDADLTRTAIAHSRRGVFHLGSEGSPPSSRALRQRVEHSDIVLLNTIAADSQSWFAALQAQGRVGTKEANIGGTLGVAERPATVYAADPQTAWRDQTICGLIRAGVPSRLH